MYLNFDRKLKERKLPQLALQIGERPAVEDVSDAVLLKKPDFLSAICLCMDVSGLQDDYIASKLDMQPAQFSKCRSGLAHFPPKKLPKLMKVCKNLIPLRWLALHCGMELTPLVSTMERQIHDLERQLAARDEEIETIKRFVRETRQ